ncbi:MAG TPA: FeoA family protein [Phycisphaerales bacterium]|nr:FeoA family protein [Phycisphaerales bacterium]HMP35838.1 FeoA family protein [Phycisphaerales bacterium]
MSPSHEPAHASSQALGSAPAHGAPDAIPVADPSVASSDEAHQRLRDPHPESNAERDARSRRKDGPAPVTPAAGSFGRSFGGAPEGPSASSSRDAPGSTQTPEALAAPPAAGGSTDEHAATEHRPAERTLVRERAFIGVPLAQLRPGDRARLHAEGLRCDQCELLNAMGLTDRCEIRVCKVGEPCIVQVAQTRLGISKRLASEILVTPVAPPPARTR